MSDLTKASALIVTGFCLFVAVFIFHTPSTSNDFSWQKAEPTDSIENRTPSHSGQHATAMAKTGSRPATAKRRILHQQKSRARASKQSRLLVRPLPQPKPNTDAAIVRADFIQSQTADPAGLSQAARQPATHQPSNRQTYRRKQTSQVRYPGLPNQHARPESASHRVVNHTYSDRSVRPASYADSEDSFTTEDLHNVWRDRAETELVKAPPALDADVDAAAMERVRYGKSLARRGAFFAARDEFFNALYLIAESHNRTASTSSYSRRLKLGLQALEEVSDFEKVGRAVHSSQPQRFVLASHNTKLVKPEDADNYTRSQLIDLYCKFAESQIHAAIGRSPAASEALFSYGKILVAQAKDWQHQDYVDAQICWTLFRASLAANANNHQTANELGIRYLKSGQFETAIQHFSRAISIADRSVYWTNLAEAHRRIADASNLEHERSTQLQLSQKAREKALQGAASSEPQKTEKWVSAEQFELHGAMPDLSLSTSQHESGVAPAAQDSRNQSRRGLFKNIKKWF